MRKIWWCEAAATVAELEKALAEINAHEGAAYLEVAKKAERSSHFSPGRETLLTPCIRQRRLMHRKPDQ